MNNNDFESKVGTLCGDIVLKVEPEFQGNAGILIFLSNGIKIYSRFWRLVEAPMKLLSSFDHDQKYGLPEPVDAIKELAKVIANLKISQVYSSKKVGDIEIKFENGAALQIFNFTGYEAWEINFPDGSEILSNYMR